MLMYEEIVKENAGLIWTIAKKFYGIPKSDLYQAGVLGVIKAYNNYKHDGDCKFSTYAYKYMLLRTFAIPTGEDPDKISSAETDSKIENEINNTIINKTKVDALNSSIENHRISDEQVERILNKYGYSSTVEIKMKDYMNIVNEFQKIVKVGA